MKNFIKKIVAISIFTTLIFTILAIPTVTNAQNPSPTPGGNTSGGTSGGSSDAPLKSVDEIIKWLDKIQQYVARIFWIIAIIAVFYSAFLYATSGGDPKNTGKARESLLYVAIAMAVAIMAYGLPQLIKSILSIT